MSEKRRPIHWADFAADNIIRERGDKDLYTIASGITPSGVVHFGNFREVMTVELVGRALKDLGKNVRFIFSWDDYDTFRKVPANMPGPEELEKFLFQPIVDTPDPFKEEESYARHHEVAFEKQLEKVGIELEPLYQAKKYRGGDYREQIKKTLKAKDKIAAILNEHRKEPLPAHWMPVSIYCEECNRDKMKEIKYDGDHHLDYHCELCSHQGKVDLNTSERVKLPWRMDWPMRWSYEKVDFEPGGKDHSSQGGSFTTAKQIVKEVFDHEPPVYVQYNFIGVKGAGGKISSSSGKNVITLNDVLNIYEPEIVRWIFASYRSNVEFSVSFDLDVIKTYEDFDRQERLAYGVEPGNEKKVNMAKRVYELASIGEQPKEMPFQPPFRHLCNLLQIQDGSIEKCRAYYAKQIKNERDERRFKERAECALHWLEKYAPDEFKFKINKTKPEGLVDEKSTQFLAKIQSDILPSWDSIETDKDMHQKLYDLIHEVEIEPQEAFKTLYQRLISQEKGPKLAGFIRTIGKERFSSLL